MTYYLPYRSSFFQGADILIEDDNTPIFGGADVSCAGGSNSVTFCNGLDGIEELGDGDFANSDCPTNGRAGTPGVGLCPSS